MMKLGNRLMLLAAVLGTFAAASASSQTVSAAGNGIRRGFMDSNGDGICDISGRAIGSAARFGQGRQALGGQGYGIGNGARLGKQLGPQDGTRLGRGNGPGMGSAPAGRCNRRAGWR